MSSRPEKWLQAIADDANDHRSLGFIERVRRALRFFRTGRSKTTQKVLRDFSTWNDRKQDKKTPSIAPAIDEPAKRPAPLQASEPLAGIRLIIADLRGGEALQRTLDALPLDAFHSHVIISPFHKNFPGDRYFDLFTALDSALSEPTDAESILILESGSVWTETPNSIPEGADAVFHRWQSDNGSLVSTPLDAQSLLREPLAPMAFPAIQFRPGITVNFANCWHYAGWDLLLNIIETNPDKALFPEQVSVQFLHHPYALSQLDRKHLKQFDPEKLRRLPDANDEWTVTRHDLITRIVQRHPDYFKNNAAYLAAIAAATRGC